MTKLGPCPSTENYYIVSKIIIFTKQPKDLWFLGFFYGAGRAFCYTPRWFVSFCKVVAPYCAKGFISATPTKNFTNRLAGCRCIPQLVIVLEKISYRIAENSLDDSIQIILMKLEYQATKRPLLGFAHLHSCAHGEPACSLQPSHNAAKQLFIL